MTEKCWRCRDVSGIRHVDEDHHITDGGDWLTCQHDDGGGGTTYYNFDYCPKCGTKLK
jgi:hypothetical protein